MSKSMETLGSYLVLALFAAQFVAFCNSRPQTWQPWLWLPVP
jgi:p-aminobenzoyl-glutamate transporter AbgT